MGSPYADALIQSMLMQRGGMTPGQAINQGTGQLMAALAARKERQQQLQQQELQQQIAQQMLGHDPQALQSALANPQALQGNPLLSQLVAQQLAPQKQQLLNVPRGGSVFDPSSGKAVYTNQVTEETKPAPIRTYQVGEQNVTEEYDPETKTWHELGRGSRVQKVEQRTGELDKKTGSDLREKFFNAQEGLGRLQAIGQTFDPTYLTLGGKAKAMKAKWQDFITGDISPEDRQYLTGYTEWASNAYDNLNRYIKEITGAAMTNAEAGRITKSLPNPESDSPTEFQTKYTTVVKQLRRAVARTRFALTMEKPIENFSLDALDSVIDQRGDELEKQFRSSGLTPEQAEAAAMKQVREEFGL
jgi:hypothetical protein